MPEIRLTPRETEVLRHVRTGESNRAIAADLGISEQAVKALVSRLLLKFGVVNRTTLAAHADRLDHLARSVDIADAEGRPFPPQEAPWARAARGEAFDGEVTLGSGSSRRRVRLRVDPLKR
jgi:DNA-binding CsgD family transcriptional regulator